MPTAPGPFLAGAGEHPRLVRVLGVIAAVLVVVGAFFGYKALSGPSFAAPATPSAPQSSPASSTVDTTSAAYQDGYQDGRQNVDNTILASGQTITEPAAVATCTQTYTDLGQLDYPQGGGDFQAGCLAGWRSVHGG